MAIFSKLPFDQKQIEAAIARLEQRSSAELRVYIERHLPKSQPSAIQYALSIFTQLAMTETQARNGVLIYIAYKDQQCAIIGDEGIHQYVGEAFWQQQYAAMVEDFQQKRYTQGVVNTIERIAQRLTLHFPIQPDDRNELDNEVIIND
ncbi:TPM domain-containing protein [Avibacterium paragallinarum]|uniref:TPM domain-containing protein n=1 Tax=Avibacterium paragallinarum TaxID=728 RepID=UPI003985BA72